MEERLKAIMATIIGVPAAEIGPGTNAREIPEWDSIAHLNLMLAVEQAFAVRFDIDQLPTLTSYDALRAALAARLDGEGTA